MMEQIDFSTLLTFSKFRSSLSLLQGQASALEAGSEQQEALAFLSYLSTLQVSQSSAFVDWVWDFNKDYPNASRYIRGAKLRIDFTKYSNIPELAILELKAAFMIILKALSGIPADGKSTRVSKKPLKPNSLISDYENGLRFLDKVYAVAAIELGKEHVDRELISIQCLPAHFYAAAAEDYDYVYDEYTEKLFKHLKSGYLQANVFGASLPFVDFSKLKWKVLGGKNRPVKDAEKKSQILPNSVFEISSQMASLSIVDFLDAMGEEVIDVASLKRRNAKEYFPSQQSGLNPLKFNLYVYKRLSNKGFSFDEVAKVLGSDVMNSSRLFSVIAPWAVKQYAKDTGSALDDQFRLYLNFVNYSCLYIIGQYTGMRPSEYAELLASSSLRPDGRYWVLASNVSKHQDNLVELFDDFWLAIPIVRDAVRVCQLISKYKNNDYIFSNVDTVAFGEQGKPFAAGSTKATLEKFFERVLPPETFENLDFHAYMMRHTLAYQLHRADLGLPFISHQLKHFGEIVGVGHSDRGFSKTTLLYGEIADRISKGAGARKAEGRSLRQEAELESIHQRFDPDGSYAGVNAEAHKESLRKVFRGYMASGHTKEDIFEAMLDQHIAVINVGSGFCYGGGVDEFDSSLPCIGGLRCNPNRCQNAIVSKANAPAWRDVYFQNKAMLGNPAYAHSHAQNKAAMEEAYGVLQLLEEEL
ncbi:integrase [Pseudomonas sp. JAI115]|uniref:site-specific integrase n=1 Tax=Pseudomonas sp. JAI115 TaxID=2723061 RepID=UPI00161AE0C0|nr:site-specific integrase [Pseudomonas sp. JAI115]MBB6154965.1 integrase [Pseudomonas sp. JAI115]